VLDLPDRLESAHGVFFLPPGRGLDLGFSEAHARDVTPAALVNVSNDPTWLVGGLLYDALDAATEDGYGAVLFALVSVLQCGKDLTDRVFSLDPAGAIADVLTCAGKNSDLIVKRYIQVAQGSGSRIAKTAVVLQRVLKVIAAAQLGAWIGEVLSDRRIDAAARKFFAYPKPPPVGAFAGTWHVHGATLVVSRLGKGSIHNNIGPCSDYSDGVFPGTGQMCNEVPLLDFSLSADGKVLTATVTKVKYQTWEGRWLPDFHPQDAPSWPKGSTIRWHLINPHLLSTRVPVTHPLLDMATQGDGNPLWCGKSATPEELLACN
jgi:hypothetical protein